MPTEDGTPMSDESRDAIGRAMWTVVSEWSESVYCATWLIDIEHILWLMKLNGPIPYGMGDVSCSEAVMHDVSTLSQLSGKWVQYEGAVDLPEWEVIHEAWKQEHESTVTWFQAALTTQRDQAEGGES